VCVCGCVGVLMTMWCSGVGLMVKASVLWFSYSHVLFSQLPVLNWTYWLATVLWS